jgi:hypothetical protein
MSTGHEEETCQSAYNSKAARVGRILSTKHEYETGVGLSIGQVTLARRRHLPPISAKGLFHEFKSAHLSKTVRARRGMSTERQLRTGVDVRFGCINHARLRYLLQSSASGLFLQHEKAIVSHPMPAR